MKFFPSSVATGYVDNSVSILGTIIIRSILTIDRYFWFHIDNNLHTLPQLT